MRIQAVGAALVASAVILAGCATIPALPAPSQVIHLKPVTGVNAIHAGGDSYSYLTAGPGRGWSSSPPSPLDLTLVDGVRCEARNDLGTWELTAPGSLRIAVSSQPLDLACRKEGFTDFTMRLRCITPRQRSTATGAMVGLRMSMMFPPAAVLVAPGVLIAAALGPPAAGAAAGAALAGEDPDLCVYAGVQGLELMVLMHPR